MFKQPPIFKNEEEKEALEDFFTTKTGKRCKKKIRGLKSNVIKSADSPLRLDEFIKQIQKRQKEMDETVKKSKSKYPMTAFFIPKNKVKEKTPKEVEAKKNIWS